MLASKLYAPTLREVPSDADVISQQYMLRAGFIRKMANGLYSFLPLAWRSIRKIEAIVREEMEASALWSHAISRIHYEGCLLL